MKMSENQNEATPAYEAINPIVLTQKEHARFWAKVNKNGPIHETQPHLGPCWLWTAGKWGRGYGAFGFRGGQIKSHRLSYLTEVGGIPAETPFVLHSCDVRLCCNPKHLFLGDYADNSHDMCSKGRQPKPDWKKYYQDHPDKIRKGTQLTHAKLTEEIVAQVLAGDYSVRGSQIQMAKNLGVTPGTICMILKGKIWKHVKQIPHAPTAPEIP